FGHKNRHHGCYDACYSACYGPTYYDACYATSCYAAPIYSASYETPVYGTYTPAVSPQAGYGSPQGPIYAPTKAAPQGVTKAVPQPYDYGSGPMTGAGQGAAS